MPLLPNTPHRPSPAPLPSLSVLPATTYSYCLFPLPLLTVGNGSDPGSGSSSGHGHRAHGDSGLGLAKYQWQWQQQWQRRTWLQLLRWDKVGARAGSRAPAAPLPLHRLPNASRTVWSPLYSSIFILPLHSLPCTTSATPATVSLIHSSWWLWLQLWL